MADGSARDRWRGGWRVAFALALALAGCGSKIEPPPPLTVTNVACFVPAGEPRENAWGPLTTANFDEYGPSVCGFALTKYFHDHPATRIAEVLPLEIPVPPQTIDRPPTLPGTQALLVVHSARGPWPQAKELEVDTRVCHDSASDTFGPSGCNEALIELLHSEKSVPLLVPLTDLTEAAIEGLHAGTRSILFVRNRRSRTEPPSSRRAPGDAPRSGP